MLLSGFGKQCLTWPKYSVNILDASSFSWAILERKRELGFWIVDLGVYFKDLSGGRYIMLTVL